MTGSPAVGAPIVTVRRGPARPPQA